MRRPRGGGKQKALVIPDRFGRPYGGMGEGEGAQGRESEHLADGRSWLGTIKDAKQRGRLRTREGGERGFLRKHRSVRVLIAFFLFLKDPKRYFCGETT